MKFNYSDINKINFVSKEESKKILTELILNSGPIAWSTIKEILDIFIPQLMQKVAEIPAYQTIMREEGFSPEKIKNFDDFDKKMPVITPETYFKIVNTPDPNDKTKKLGANAFMPSSYNKSDELSFSYGYNKYYSSQYVITKGKPPLTFVSSEDDITASAIGLASALKRYLGKEYYKFLLQQKPNENSIVKCVLKQAYAYAESIELPNSTQRQFLSSNNHHDISAYSGFFPTNLGSFLIQFPNLMYAVDKNGHKTNSTGIFVVSNIFSVIENPFGVNSILKKGIEFIINNNRQNNVSIDILKQFLHNQHYDILMGMLGPIEDYKDLAGLYKKVVSNWIKQDLIFVPPKGTIFLKFAVPIAGVINDNGEILHQEIITKNIKIGKGKIFLHRHSDYPIRHQPCFLRNIVAGEIRESPMGVRVHDITLGHHKEHFPKGREYLYFQPSVLKRDADDALKWSQEKVKVQLQLAPTIDDIHQILYGLYKKISNDRELLSLFVMKSGLPIREVKELLKSAEKFIHKDNLKKLAYAALIDHNANLEKLNEESEIRKGIQSLALKSPLSPFYLVTASNLNPLDWFKIMSELLLATISGKSLVYNIRSSESDLFSSYSVYYFNEIVEKKVSDARNKGLLNMFQRLFWNPNTHPEYSIKFMESSHGSISFGTLKSFIHVESQAAYNAAVNSNGFSHQEIKNLLEYGSVKKYRLNIFTLNSVKKAFSEQKISKPLYDFISNFIGKNVFYQETLNAVVILNDVPETELDRITGQLLEKGYKLRGCDCTSLQNVFVSDKIYDAFFSVLKEKSSKLVYGDIMDERTDLALYSSVELNDLQLSIKKFIKPENYEIICPISIDGLRAKNGIIIEKGVSGVVLVKFDIILDKIIGDDKHNKLIKGWLAKQQNVPLLNIIRYESYKDLIEGLNNIRVAFQEATDYGAYTYISLIGKTDEINMLKPNIGPMADLILENTLNFNPLQPHNRRYFLRDVLGLGPIK